MNAGWDEIDNNRVDMMRDFSSRMRSCLGLLCLLTCGAGASDNSQLAPTIYHAEVLPAPLPQAEEPAPVLASPAPAIPPANDPATATAPQSPERSKAELEKLVAPIALYPDPLLAAMLPAAAYPIEIVLAARFVKDTNNLPSLNEQPWDESVKTVARFPETIQWMSENLKWTVQLGQAFVVQPKAVMAAVQTLRAKAQAAGNLRSTPEQTVVLTNEVVQQTNGPTVATVTNQVWQIWPAQPGVVYVPQYDPVVVYSPAPAWYYPSYYSSWYYPWYYDPFVPVVTFGVGVWWGASYWGCCNWSCGWVSVPPLCPYPPYSCYYPGAPWYGYPWAKGSTASPVGWQTGTRGAPPPRATSTAAATTKTWQPDVNRLRESGTRASVASVEGRNPAARPTHGVMSATPRTSTGFGNRIAPAPGAGVASRPSPSPAVLGGRAVTAASSGSRAVSTAPARSVAPSRPAPAYAPRVTRAQGGSMPGSNFGRTAAPGGYRSTPALGYSRPMSIGSSAYRGQSFGRSSGPSFNTYRGMGSAGPARTFSSPGSFGGGSRMGGGGSFGGRGAGGGSFGGFRR